MAIDQAIHPSSTSLPASVSLVPLYAQDLFFFSSILFAVPLFLCFWTANICACTHVHSCTHMICPRCTRTRHLEHRQASFLLALSHGTRGLPEGRHCVSRCFVTAGTTFFPCLFIGGRSRHVRTLAHRSVLRHFQTLICPIHSAHCESKH